MSETEQAGPLTAREQLAAQIAADAGTRAKVVAHPEQPTNIAKGKMFVAVYRSKLDRHADRRVLRHDLTVDVYASTATGAGAENEADDALDAVLLSIQRHPGTVFEEAERTQFDGKFAGYRVRATWHSPDVYAAAIRHEARAAAAAGEEA